MDIDLGDVVASFNLRIKGRHRPRYRISWRVGAPTDTASSERVINWRSYAPNSRKVLFAMDLQADKKVSLSLQWTDEVGNPVGAPDGASVAFTVDDPSIINLTDNGDGTGEAAAIGALGTANIHVEASAGDVSLSGDLQIVVVAGLAERISISVGDPEEVTPDA